MMTPLDIQNTKFQSSALGYKKNEVDEFMTDIIKDYEKLYIAYNESKEKISSLNKMLETYKGMEETMKNTLLVAQQSAEQLTRSAKSESESILAEANQKSGEIISRATQRLEELNAQYEKLKKEIRNFVMCSKAEFEVQIKNLDDAQKEIEEIK